MVVVNIVNSIGITYGGTGLSALNLAQSVAVDNDVKIILYVLKFDSIHWPVDRNLNIIYAKNENNFFGRYISAIRFLKINSAINSKILHIHGIWSPLNALIFCWAKLNGWVCIISTHGSLESWAFKHKFLKKRIAFAIYQKFLLNLADAIWTNSNDEKNSVRKLDIRSPIIMIPNGISIQSEESILSFKTKKNKVVRQALFMSRIHPVKGLPLLVYAWAKIKPIGWRMMIAGSDESGHRQEIEDMINKLGIQDDFIWVGMLSGDAKLNAFAESDLFVLPTHSENFGIVIAEALAAGLPVVTTKGAPWAELLEQQCGWWCDVTVDGLSQALAEAMSQTPDTLAAMGRRGRTFVYERYAWPKLGIEANSAYRWLANTKSGKASSSLPPPMIHIQ